MRWCVISFFIHRLSWHGMYRVIMFTRMREPTPLPLVFVTFFPIFLHILLIQMTPSPHHFDLMIDSALSLTYLWASKVVRKFSSTQLLISFFKENKRKSRLRLWSMTLTSCLLFHSNLWSMMTTRLNLFHSFLRLLFSDNKYKCITFRLWMDEVEWMMKRKGDQQSLL